MDGQIEASAEAYLSALSSVRVGIEEVRFDYSAEEFSFPCEGILEINKQENKVTLSAGQKPSKQLKSFISCEFSGDYPQINFLKWTNNIFDIYFAPDKSMRLSCKNNIERDIYALCIRTITGEQLLRHDDLKEETRESVITDRELEKKADSIQSNEKTSIKVDSQRDTSRLKGNLELLMKISNLTHENSVLKKENSSLVDELKIERAAKELLEGQVGELAEQLTDLNQSFDALLERAEELKKKNDKLNSEKIFCAQEINLYKSQAAQLQELYDSLLNAESIQIKQYSRGHELEAALKAAENDIHHWKTKALNTETEHAALKAEMALLSKNNVRLTEQIETLESQINHLNRKYQSLLLETEKGGIKKRGTFSPVSDSPSFNSERVKALPAQEFDSIAWSHTKDSFSEITDETVGPKSYQNTPKNEVKLTRKRSEDSSESFDREKPLMAERLKVYESEIELLKTHVAILEKTLET